MDKMLILDLALIIMLMLLIMLMLMLMLMGISRDGEWNGMGMGVGMNRFHMFDDRLSFSSQIGFIHFQSCYLRLIITENGDIEL